MGLSRVRRCTALRSAVRRSNPRRTLKPRTPARRMPHQRVQQTASGRAQTSPQLHQCARRARTTCVAASRRLHAARLCEGAVPDETPSPRCRFAHLPRPSETRVTTTSSRPLRGTLGHYLLSGMRFGPCRVRGGSVCLRQPLAKVLGAGGLELILVSFHGSMPVQWSSLTEECTAGGEGRNPLAPCWLRIPPVVAAKAYTATMVDTHAPEARGGSAPAAAAGAGRDTPAAAAAASSKRPPPIEGVVGAGDTASASAPDAAAAEAAAPPSEASQRLYSELASGVPADDHAVLLKNAFVKRPLGMKVAITGMALVTASTATPKTPSGGRDGYWYWIPVRNVLAECPQWLTEQEVDQFIHDERGAKTVRNEHMYMQRVRCKDVLSVSVMSDKKLRVTAWKDGEQYVESTELAFANKAAQVQFRTVLAKAAGLEATRAGMWERKKAPVGSQDEHNDWLYSEGAGRKGLRLPGMVWGTGKKLLGVLGTVGAELEKEITSLVAPSTSPPRTAHVDPAAAEVASDAAEDEGAAGEDEDAQVVPQDAAALDDDAMSTETPEDFPTCPSFELPNMSMREHRKPIDVSEDVLAALDLDTLRAEVFRGGAGCSEGSRRAIWMRLLGLSALSEADIHDEYRTYRAQYEGVTQKQRRYFTWLARQETAIEKDIHRTDRDVDMFEDGDGTGMTMLRNILTAYVMFNRDLEYVQGMSDIAALACYVMQDEPTAFCCFQVLMEGMVPVMNDNTAEERGVLKKVLRLIAADTAEQLDDLDPDGMYCFRWLWMRFKREFAFDDVLHLWDILLAAPVARYHLVVAASILGHLSQAIQSFDNGSQVIRFCQSLNGNVPVESVVAISEDNWNNVLGSVPPVVEMLAAPCPAGAPGGGVAKGSR